LERLAVVYVRQSTMQQVLEHQESTRLQYGLVRRAVAWGWPEARGLVIDEDLGRSGTSAEDRHGVQRLVAEVGRHHVGGILGVEMSRLARSDWHPLVEICALFGALIADLHLLKQRLYQGTLQKARRGALHFALPVGYVHNTSGDVVYDPDDQVQSVVRLIFRKFEDLGTLHALLRYLVQHDIQLGVRLQEGPPKGTLEWRRPNRMTLQNMLKHPIYAGAYAYGRRQVGPRKQQPGRPAPVAGGYRAPGVGAPALDRLWQQRLERAAYERERAARHYRLVEPEHRLVARQLAKDWEDKLRAQRQLQEEYERFLQVQPQPLSAAERAAIAQLAHNIPALWHAPTTTLAERKEIIRQIIQRVMVAGEGMSERLQITIEWVGGGTTYGMITRPISRLAHLSDYPRLCERIRTLAHAGYSTVQITACLAREGFRSPKQAKPLSRQSVVELMRRLAVHQLRRRYRPRQSQHE
jgi:hypothetical protein